jgi:rubrerythrin
LTASPSVGGREAARLRLIATLQAAYSGERAAGYAYRGHWRSVSDEAERQRIREIEEEEWHHRRLVGEMLAALGAGPRRGLEWRAVFIGRTLGVLCHVSPWFAPMYGAGRLESHNVKEYEDGARHAKACGHEEFVDCLLTMAEVEWEHEAYFRSKVVGHPLCRFFALWPPPPPKAAIRRLLPETASASAADQGRVESTVARPPVASR